MSVLQQFKCPSCDGAIEFDAAQQKMKCPYCDCEFEMESLLAYQADLDQEPKDDMTWDAQAGGQWQEGEAENLRIYSCQSCGGEVVADATTGATHCPYCDNPIVMTAQFSGSLKPDMVIPFQVDKKAAVEALKNHYKGKRLLPKVFKDQNHIEEVKGLYVPVWLFDTDADAHVRYRTTRTRTWSTSDYIYKETSHFAVTRAGDIGFENVPVDGSTKMDDTLMESIEPFDVTAAVDFQTAYLAGYLADKYDVDAENSIQRANDRIRQSTEDAFAATVMGYDTVRTVSSNISLQNGRARYALYPVWILNTRWNDKRFTFAVNGQTGKVAGDLPMDKGAFWRWFLGVTGAVTAGVLAVLFLLSML